MAEFTAVRQNQGVIAIKPEVTAGTDVFAGTYLAADVIPVLPDSVRFSQDPNEIENTMTAGNLGRGPSILGALTARLDFSMYVRGTGSAYSTSNRPKVDLPLRACAMAATVDATGGSEKITYQPSSTEEVMTVYFMLNVPGGNGLAAAKMSGCLATHTFSATAGGLGRFDFTFMGSLDRADHTFTGGTIALTPVFPTLKSALFQIGTTNYAPRIANVSLAMNNVMSYLRSINAAAGVAGVKIFDRKPILTIDPEADREANSGWWAQLRDGGPMNDMSFRLGATQYNRMQVRVSAASTPAAALQVIGQGIGSRDGVMTLPTQLLATIQSGNDDFAYEFS
jgi:tail tube protein